MNKLEEIIAYKKNEAERLREHSQNLKKMAFSRDDFRDFRASILRNEEISLIAEVKKASPSAGDIATDVDPVIQACQYAEGGAHALSILTDEKFFKGSISYLRDIRKQVELPLLRKDFIVTSDQVYESVVAGADAILLIVAALNEHDLGDFYQRARDAQMDVLVEVHNLSEMDRALDLGADIIGINNRDLTTFEVNIQTTADLAQEIPCDCVAVSESGIRTRADVLLCKNEGINAILVGETLMRSENVAGTIQELFYGPRCCS